MKQVVWSLEAVNDRLAIHEYLKVRNVVAALKLDRLISNKVVLLQGNPQMGKLGRIEGTSELVIHSNYMIVYKLLNHQIFILNIVHTSRQWPPLG